MNRIAAASFSTKQKVKDAQNVAPEANEDFDVLLKKMQNKHDPNSASPDQELQNNGAEMAEHIQESLKSAAQQVAPKKHAWVHS